jgi:hypothetical protein
MSSRHHDQVRWLTPSAALLAAALIGFGTRSLWPKAAGQPEAAAASVPVSVAQVVRTDVAQRQVDSGTLGYRDSFSVVNELPAGVLTWLPAPGQIVRRGHPLYRLANQTVTLCYGPVPAWRDIGPGITPGPDVSELDANLDSLGFGAGPPAYTYTWATEVAIERWQQAQGMTVTGTIPLGQVVFLPGPLRIANASTAAGAPPGPGTPAGPGTPVLSGTSTQPSVQVNLTPGGPAVIPGDQVLVTLPDGTTTVHGTVRAVGSVTTAQSANGTNGTQGTPGAVIPIQIQLAGYPGGDDQAPVQVTITEQEDKNVLAVPVTALLAQPGGGYAVRTATGAQHRTIPVITGLFDDETGVVEVSGPGLIPGLAVEVAQG